MIALAHAYCSSLFIRLCLNLLQFTCTSGKSSISCRAACEVHKALQSLTAAAVPAQIHSWMPKSQKRRTLTGGRMTTRTWQQPLIRVALTGCLGQTYLTRTACLRTTMQITRRTGMDPPSLLPMGSRRGRKVGLLACLNLCNLHESASPGISTIFSVVIAIKRNAGFCSL